MKTDPFIYWFIMKRADGDIVSTKNVERADQFLVEGLPVCMAEDPAATQSWEAACEKGVLI